MVLGKCMNLLAALNLAENSEKFCEQGENMRLTKLFKNEKLSLSFEVFPPKTDTSFESVKEATEEIAEAPAEEATEE